jgi:predicted AAA+ superfamily ATPase
MYVLQWFNGKKWEDHSEYGSLEEGKASLTGAVANSFNVKGWRMVEIKEEWLIAE